MRSWQRSALQPFDIRTCWTAVFVQGRPQKKSASQKMKPFIKRSCRHQRRHVVASDIGFHLLRLWYSVTWDSIVKQQIDFTLTTLFVGVDTLVMPVIIGYYIGDIELTNCNCISYQGHHTLSFSVTVGTSHGLERHTEESLCCSYSSTFSHHYCNQVFLIRQAGCIHNFKTMIM